MSDNGNHSDYLEEELFAEEITAVAEHIYRAYLPSYLKESWESGRGKWYEDIIREQLDSLILSETYEDPERVEELKRLQNMVALLIGILGASFRILDHIGMHLRGQTFGQYELLPEDKALLRKLCRHFLKAEPLDLNPFYMLSE